MPFNLARLMPEIEDLASYYAHELTPDLLYSAQQAWALLRETGQGTLREAAQRQTMRVLAVPLEEPAQVLPAVAPPDAYRVLASDGSAIDPDPHFPARYAVIHVGLAGLAYSPPACWTEQRILLRYRREDMGISYPGTGDAVPVEGAVIQTLRAYEELRLLWEGTQQIPADALGRPLLTMMDAIILWTHRGSGPGHDALKEDYLTRSVDLLERFRQAGIPLVSFISTPHHREVVHTLLAQFCPDGRRLDCGDCTDPQGPCTVLRGLQDGDLFAFLSPGERSALFQPIYQGDTGWRLPPAARRRDPCISFFYVNTGLEVARVELPRWIHEAGLTDQVQGILLDQCSSRRAETTGYPVALTLAHDEAILTSADRQTIRWSIEEALARQRVYAAPSAKARTKER